MNNTRGLAKLVVDFPQAYPQKVNFWLSAHLRSAPFRLGVKFGWGDSMPGVISDRAIHYREQSERFHRLANMEIQPRTRARLLELADDYQQLADTNRKNRVLARLSSKRRPSSGGTRKRPTSWRDRGPKFWRLAEHAL